MPFVELVCCEVEVVSGELGHVATFGECWRNGPLVFSFDPLCQGDWGHRSRPGCRCRW